MAFSIQQLYRNSVLLLAVALIAILTVILTVVSHGQLRNSYQRELALQARMVALQLSAFHEDAAMTNTLFQSVKANARLKRACLFSMDAQVVASLDGTALIRDESLGNCRALALSSPGRAYVMIRAPLVDTKLPKPIGEVLLVEAAPSMLQFVGLWVSIATILSLLVALVCWWLGIRFEQSLLTPVRNIARTAQRVSLYKDYSLRVVASALQESPREVEALTEAFNAMLKEIEDRDTRLTRKSEELDKSRQVAESASLAKSQFLSNVSHELRTPLNAIIGFSTMLNEQTFGPLGDPKYTEYSRDIMDSGRHLLDVINDILDLTKAETGKMSVTFSALVLAKIIEKALRIVSGQAHLRRIDIYTDLPEKLPKIIADRVRLVQILLNLLSNAIKFTPEGGKVVIRARSEAGKNGVHYFTLEVEDNGIGMTEEQIRKAFSSFNQADTGLNRKYEGAGLGLPLTKRLVELHHGKIKIESTHGQGTTVTVRLISDPALLD